LILIIQTERLGKIMSLTVKSGTDLSTLFSSISTSEQGSSNILADYASIKNGSYGKLVKAYYSKKSEETSKSDGDVKSTDETVSKNATSLKLAADALTDDKSLFTKSKVTKDENGNETKDYDWDSITSKVQSFVDAYNDTVKQAANSDSTGVLRATLNMTKSTGANSGMLSSAGISVNSDNTLSLDKDKLKSAQVTDLKSLFQGVGSFAYNVGTSASTVAMRAATSAATYTSAGSYSGLTSVSSVLDAYM